MSKVVLFREFALRTALRKQGIRFIESARGYPAVRDPAAENPQGVMNVDLDETSLHKLRQHYGPALVR